MRRALITVGQQLPFDRLVKLSDQCASEVQDWSWFAQIGIGGHPPNLMASAETVSADEFDNMMEQADLIIGHAGIGTILGALALGKPIAIMAREARFSEHRNDHQLATLERFSKLPGVTPVRDLSDLQACLADIENGDKADPREVAKLPDKPDDQLLAMVSSFIGAVEQPP